MPDWSSVTLGKDATPAVEVTGPTPPRFVLSPASLTIESVTPPCAQVAQLSRLPYASFTSRATAGWIATPTAVSLGCVPKASAAGSPGRMVMRLPGALEPLIVPSVIENDLPVSAATAVTDAEP